jgi:hypothetical protein
VAIPEREHCGEGEAANGTPGKYEPEASPHDEQHRTHSQADAHRDAPMNDANGRNRSPDATQTRVRVPEPTEAA